MVRVYVPMLHPDDTIVALSTAAGPGARAVVRLSGPQALPIASAVFTGSDLRPERRRFEGTLSLTGSSLPADLYVFPSPRSYTGQDVVEIHTISCPPLLDLLVAELLRAGARAAQAGEFTLRAFLAGKLDLPRAEAVLGVIEARDRDDLGEALAQLAGGVTQPLHGLRDELLNLLADLEAGLDFAEEDIQFVQQEELLKQLSRGLAHLILLQKQLTQRTVSGRPFRVVLVGRPNAGKSSLFNLLGGGRALVSPRPGTTRDYLTRRLTLGGTAVELVDTAGWQEATNDIDRQAQTLGREQGEQADLLLLCVEAGRAPDEAERAVLRPGGAAGGWRSDHVRPGRADVGDDRYQRRHRCRTRGTARAAGGASARPAAVAAGPEPEPLPPSRRGLRAAPAPRSWNGPVRGACGTARRGAARALDEFGALVGAVYTEDLLDRIFSRFCIGK